MKATHCLDKIEYISRSALKPSASAIFIWIPKTAGTSLFETLRASIGMRMFKRSHRLPRIRNAGHYTFCHLHYPSLVKMRVVSKLVDQSSFKFSVVRDPYYRALSLYFYLLRPGREEVSVRSFKEFLSRVKYWRPSVGVYNHYGLMHANPQVDWLVGENGFVVDKIFDISELSDCLQTLERYTGKSIDSPPYRNVSDYDEDYREALLGNSDIRGMIEDIYKRDFDLLGYPLWD